MCRLVFRVSVNSICFNLCIRYGPANMNMTCWTACNGLPDTVPRPLRALEVAKIAYESNSASSRCSGSCSRSSAPRRDDDAHVNGYAPLVAMESEGPKLKMCVACGERGRREPQLVYKHGVPSYGIPHSDGRVKPPLAILTSSNATVDLIEVTPQDMDPVSMSHTRQVQS